MSEFIPFSMTASENPDFFERIQEVLFLRAALINSHMFLELRQLDPLERNASISHLTDVLIEMSH